MPRSDGRVPLAAIAILQRSLEKPLRPRSRLQTREPCGDDERGMPWRKRHALRLDPRNLRRAGLDRVDLDYLLYFAWVLAFLISELSKFEPRMSKRKVSGFSHRVCVN